MEQVGGVKKKGFLPGVQSISVGSNFYSRFAETDIVLIQKIDEFQRQGFVLAAAVEKAGEL